MIDLGSYEACVCVGRANPNSLCEADLAFEEKGKKGTLSIRSGEEAKALAIDGCVFRDNLPNGCFFWSGEINDI